MKAKVYVSYKDGILDPQGQPVGKALSSIGVDGISNVQIGKYIELSFGNISKEEAKKITEESCKKLLANPNTETFKFEIIEDSL